MHECSKKAFLSLIDKKVQEKLLLEWNEAKSDHRHLGNFLCFIFFLSKRATLKKSGMDFRAEERISNMCQSMKQARQD